MSPGMSIFAAAMKKSTSKTPNIYFYLQILFLIQDESFSTSSSAIFSIVVERKSMHPMVSLIPGISVSSILTGRIYSLFSRNAATDGVECTYEDEPEGPEQRMKWLNTVR
jgi:hypothetical protein